MTVSNSRECGSFHGFCVFRASFLVIDDALLQHCSEEASRSGFAVTVSLLLQPCHGIFAFECCRSAFAHCTGHGCCDACKASSGDAIISAIVVAFALLQVVRCG